MEKRESRREKTRSLIRRRKEKGYFNNIVQELMIEDTPGYRENDSGRFSRDTGVIEPDIKPLLCFRLRLGVSSVTISPFSTTSTKASSSFLKH